MTANQPDRLEPRHPRRHDLDALRGFAMLLGIMLHAGLSFMDFPWVVQDRSKVPDLGIVFFAIHGFRMPLFFLLSGFFTAMLWRRRGLMGLLRHRAMRIALPLALGCVTIVPLMWVLVIWAGTSNLTKDTVEPDTGSDIWTAATHGALDVVRGHVEGGASLDDLDPTFGVTPLGWSVTGDQPAVIDFLLEAGADPSGRYRDRNTPLHTAAFFGRAEAVARLLDAGADVNGINFQGETPLDSMRHDQGTTEYIAGVLRLSIDFDEVVAGRDRIGPMLEGRGATSGLGDRSLLKSVIQGLMAFPFFHHLWFLWFLCWLALGFALVAAVFRNLPPAPIPAVLIATPLCLLWLVPLTMLTQSSMHRGGAVPGFGPDTSAGLLPIPHVLAYYAIFFGFGALVYGSPGAADRLGRSWWLTLPLGMLLFPVSVALSLQTPWGLELVGDEGTRIVLANLGQVLYAWLMIFGLMGLFEAVLSSERPWVRYLSDSSYWLYLVHLPLIILGQALIRDANLPAGVKLTILITVASVILLASYQLLVRYTWIGRLLNGRRDREAGPHPRSRTIR